MRVPRGEHERWKCRTQRRPAALLTMCHRASSRRVLFFLPSSHLILLFPSFLYPFWTFPFPLTRAVRACVPACLRARTQVRTKGIWVYNATEALRSSGQYTTTRQRRATTRCFPGIRYRRSRFTRASMRTRKHVHIYLRNASYILACISYTDRRILHTGIYRCVYVPGPACRSLGSLLLARTREVVAMPERASERANERASQPAAAARMRPAYVYTGPSLRLAFANRSFLFLRPRPGNISRVILPREER